VSHSKIKLFDFGLL